MTRLSRHRKRVMTNEIIIISVLIIGGLIFLFNYGFKFIINTSLLVNKAAKGNSDNAEVTKAPDFFGIFTVDSVPDATNSAKIAIAGTVENYNKIVFYLDDEKVKEVDVSGDSFNETIDGLKKGENQVYLIAVSKNPKKEKRSEEFTVLYKDDKPKLEITSPADNSKTSQQEINLAGKTDAKNSLSVNGSPVVVDAQGNFYTSVKLKEGENKIAVVSTDDFGNSENKTITVTYQKED